MVVMGSDGLWDNLSTKQILDEVITMPIALIWTSASTLEHLLKLG